MLNATRLVCPLRAVLNGQTSLAAVYRNRTHCCKTYVFMIIKTYIIFSFCGPRRATPSRLLPAGAPVEILHHQRSQQSSRAAPPAPRAFRVVLQIGSTSLVVFQPPVWLHLCHQRPGLHPPDLGHNVQAGEDETPRTREDRFGVQQTVER